MSAPVILRRAARAEFDEAADWYEGRSIGRGAASTAAVGRALAGIATRPRAHPVVHEDIREALVARHPDAIYDRIEPHQVTMLAIFLSYRTRPDRMAGPPLIGCRAGSKMRS